MSGANSLSNIIFCWSVYDVILINKIVRIFAGFNSVYASKVKG